MRWRGLGGVPSQGLLFRVGAQGLHCGLGGWLAGLVPGCVSQDRKASLLVLGGLPASKQQWASQPMGQNVGVSRDLAGGRGCEPTAQEGVR